MLSRRGPGLPGPPICGFVERATGFEPANASRDPSGLTTGKLPLRISRVPPALSTSTIADTHPVLTPTSGRRTPMYMRLRSRTRVRLLTPTTSSS
jgi:hypothetical protein